MTVATRTPIPTEQSMLTPGWLTSALRESGTIRHATVTNLDVTEIGIGRGYVCLALRLRPTYDEVEPSAPASLVAKIPHFVAMPDEASARLIEDVRATEVYWYRDMAPNSPVRVPRCYWSGDDPVARVSALLLEDLGDLRTAEQAAGCAVADADLAVRALARVHARWWEDNKVRALPWIHGPDYTGALWQERYAAGWPFAREQLRDRLPGAFLPIGDALCTQMANVHAEAAASASTLAHGDYRVENFLFGKPGTDDEICVLDWQLASWGSGLYDLGYLLGQSLLPEVRRPEEDRFVRLYHDSLVEAGVANYTFDQCRVDYRRGLLMAMSIAFQVFGLVDQMYSDGPGDVDALQAEQWRAWLDAGVDLITIMATRAAEAAVDNDAGSVLRL